MRESNSLYEEENRAKQIARRLQEQNESVNLGYYKGSSLMRTHQPASRAPSRCE